MRTSKFLAEKKLLIQKANYKKALCFSELDINENILSGEETLNPESKNIAVSSTNGLLAVLKKHKGIDLVETGSMKIKNLSVLRALLEHCNLICEIEITSIFLELPFKFSAFLSTEKKVKYLANLIKKNISYYEKNKKIICFIR